MPVAIDCLGSFGIRPDTRFAPVNNMMQLETLHVFRKCGYHRVRYVLSFSIQGRQMTHKAEDLQTSSMWKLQKRPGHSALLFVTSNHAYSRKAHNRCLRLIHVTGPLSGTFFNVGR